MGARRDQVVLGVATAALLALPVAFAASAGVRYDEPSVTPVEAEEDAGSGPHGRTWLVFERVPPARVLVAEEPVDDARVTRR